MEYLQVKLKKKERKKKITMSKLIKNKIKKLHQQMTKENAIKIAKENGLEYEVLQSIKAGCTPQEALREWDLI